MDKSHTCESNDLLKRQAVIEAIESEPEYPDAGQFVDDVRQTIMDSYEINDHLASALADMVISCARIACRNTKKAIYDKILAL